MIEILDGFWLDPWSVKVVKAISENRCALWMDGQNATEGFVLDYPGAEVVQAVLEAREQMDEVPEEEEPEPDDEVEDD